MDKDHYWRFLNAVRHPYPVLMGSSYLTPLASSETLINADVCVTFSRILSSSSRCFSASPRPSSKAQISVKDVFNAVNRTLVLLDDLVVLLEERLLRLLHLLGVVALPGPLRRDDVLLVVVRSPRAAILRLCVDDVLQDCATLCLKPGG